MEIKYSVKKSGIDGAGMGLFADEFVPKGKIIWRLKDEYCTIYHSKQSLEKVLAKMSREEAINHLVHCFNLDPDTVVHETDDGKYINHSPQYNMIQFSYTFKDRDKLCLYATRDIKPGEELLENYHNTYYCPEYENKWLTEIEKRYGLWIPQKPDP
mmetsp:Transcript_64184/g.102202  ORF Transcript_64184/g.102202 Transcript_64184/m.102202 type:complete len:156 (+) Transcript_64184:156-623(+)|eukprot:CAMPEP_0197072324 /NCGR_PEP_ID=MMETSP1384-20130603/210040_1 /TAXON_ID=29189 /ORGANISM="Ammonia sp." /LENGTH=155 /DNA_ID=CAMNT_0042511141 /DNA_START=150 /DNA_END=617 /DNA_ORIENTATION=+